MAIPIIKDWEKYFQFPHEGLGSSYERIILNRILDDVAQRFEVKSALETPSFGFTGISGINLIHLADSGIDITLEDHDPQRLGLIRELWQELKRPLTAKLNSDYSRLDYADDGFDLSFSFSALWFVRDLRIFLSELARVSKRAIFISVPNQSGIGYQGQLKGYSPELYPQLHLPHIDPGSIIAILRKLGWDLCESGLFDCPLWPDIGMSKEDYLSRIPFLAAVLKHRIDKNIESAVHKPLSILDHYRGLDAGFPGRMLRYAWLERYAPQCFKRVWAHHCYMLFVPH
ncbi:MAG: methyltransferase domain-containing protein [Candidatus Cloacimonadaceae bacterium]|nr:methyltransferase domain-containing protein [Candidatus Cloacimonadaceae bacterium]